MNRRRSRDRAGGYDRWWLAAVVALALPALVSPLALMPLPEGFPMRLLGVLQFVVGIADHALWSALAATAAAGLAQRFGDLDRRWQAACWAVVVLAWLIAATTAGRLAAVRRL